MTAGVDFFLVLILRMAVSAAFVVAASMVAERLGPFIGALIATLPVSAGPAYVFLAVDHDSGFIAASALASLPMNAATVLMNLVIIGLARRLPVTIGLAAGICLWFAVAMLVRSFAWTLLGGVGLNIFAFALSLPAAERFRTAKTPPVARRWYDVPLRAGLVAALVATLVLGANFFGPRLSGVIALFPVVFTSLILILGPRIGAQATVAVLANAQWGMIGLSLALVVLGLAAEPLGRAAALSLALATCVFWNLGLFLYQRRREAPARAATT
ncbi:MAG TPA: hypothetical protein VN668_04940 [Stellaceae bacterium]|nr:hypothetical protein [Stellaceae bacterium]